MEKIFNLFPICNDKIITHIGFRVHEMEGTDAEKIDFLKNRVEEDIEELLYIEISDNFVVKLPDGTEVNGITSEKYATLAHNGTTGVFYEPIFQAFGASETPLMVITPIIDGEIKIDSVSEIPTVPLTSFTQNIKQEIPANYLDHYLTEEGFNMDKLIDDDFFEPIYLLYNNQHFVSCLKLFMSTIDTIAYLEYGDIPSNFKQWIDTYCDFSKLNVTSDELWEYRNSLLHMTNAVSRKVRQNRVNKLRFYVSEKDREELISDGEAKFFNLRSLIITVSEGISVWANSFNSEPSKFNTFVERYDIIISEKRFSNTHLSDS